MNAYFSKTILCAFVVSLVFSESFSQNVGIGTSVPAQKLHVAGAGTTIRVDGLSGVGTRTVYVTPAGDLTISAGTPAQEWLTLGNAGTSAATNYLGTSDAVDFIIRTNATERMRFLSTGNIGIGTIGPLARLHVETSTGVAVRGSQTGFGSGYLGYSGTISLGAFGSTPGAVVFSEEGTATSNPSFIAVTRSPATYAANIAYSNVWIGGYFGVDNSSTSFNPPGLYGQLNVTVAFPSVVFQNAISGYMNRGSTAGNTAYSVGVSGVANSQNQDAFGVLGRTYCSNATFSNSGGYFEANAFGGSNYAFAYVANAGSNRKIAGSGSVSEIIPTENHGRVTLTCPESPEYWYQDYGTAALVNGRAHVALDPILADIIIVDNANPIRVFCTPVDMLNFNGVAITNRTSNGFDIVELNGGTSNGLIDYQIVVKPKTNYGEGRFRQAPGPVGLKPDQEPAMAKAKNRPDPASIWKWPSDQEVYGYELPKVQPEKLKAGN